MEWLFLVLTVAVLWLIERQYNRISGEVDRLDEQVESLRDDFEKFKIDIESITKGEESPRK